MRIELKGLKIAKFASEETICFSASVYADGKKFAEAYNHGTGGNTDVRATNQELFKKAEEFCASLPRVVTTWKDPNDPTKLFSYAMDLEHVVDDLVYAAEKEREVTRLKKKILKEDFEHTFFRLEGENTPLSYRVLKAKGDRAKEFLNKKYGAKYRLVTAIELCNEAKAVVHA